MKRFSVQLLTVATITALLFFTAQSAIAAEFPEKGKVITVIVTYGAGGGSDVTARTIMPMIEKELGVRMPIINKPGGGGQVGFTYFVKTAKPDGYTLVLATEPGVSAQYLDPKRQATYSRKSFKLVCNLVIDPVTILVRPDSPYKNIKDLIEAARANPRKIRITTAGLMVTSDIAAIQLETSTGVKFAHMFYEQQGEQRSALLGGHADAEFNPVSETAHAIVSGELRSLGVCDNMPNRFIPNVPTVMSQGYKSRMASSRGLAAAAGTPDDRIKIIADAAKRALAKPENQKVLEKLMLAARVMTGDEYEEYWAGVDQAVQAVLDGLK